MRTESDQGEEQPQAGSLDHHPYFHGLKQNEGLRVRTVTVKEGRERGCEVGVEGFVLESRGSRRVTSKQKNPQPGINLQGSVGVGVGGSCLGVPA